MKNLLEGVEEILLMGPGPSLVPPQVYKALSRKTIGHLDPYFLEIMEEVKEMLRKIMNTNNTITLPLSGTGSAGMAFSREGEESVKTVLEGADNAVRGILRERMKEGGGR